MADRPGGRATARRPRPRATRAATGGNRATAYPAHRRTDRHAAPRPSAATPPAPHLNYAAPRGGITEPATIAAVTADLSTAAYRLPQLLTALGAWIIAEAAAGRLADDHSRPPAQLTVRIRDTLRQADDNAETLAASLSAVHNLAATLHAARPAAPAV
jgi:hypothetical protein